MCVVLLTSLNYSVSEGGGKIKEINYKDLILFLIGMSLYGLGISISIKSNFGVSAYDSFTVGLSLSVGLTVGTWMNIISFILLICTWVINKKISIKPLITSFTLGILTDLFNFIIPSVEINNVLISGFVFFIGIIIISLGVGIYQNSSYPLCPADEFIISIKSISRFKLSSIYVVYEVFFLLGGIITHGPVGIGTVISAFIFGPLIAYFKEMTNKLIEYK